MITTGASATSTDAANFGVSDGRTNEKRYQTNHFRDRVQISSPDLFAVLPQYICKREVDLGRSLSSENRVLDIHSLDYR